MKKIYCCLFIVFMMLLSLNDCGELVDTTVTNKSGHGVQCGDRYVDHIYKKYDDNLSITFTYNESNYINVLSHYNCVIQKIYFVDNKKVVEGKTNYKEYKTFQLVMDDDFIKIGFPTIWEGF